MIYDLRLCVLLVGLWHYTLLFFIQWSRWRCWRGNIINGVSMFRRHPRPRASDCEGDFMKNLKVGDRVAVYGGIPGTDIVVHGTRGMIEAIGDRTITVRFCGPHFTNCKDPHKVLPGQCRKLKPPKPKPELFEFWAVIPHERYQTVCIAHCYETIETARDYAGTRSRVARMVECPLGYKVVKIKEKK